MRTRQCLNCRNYEPKPSPDWKPRYEGAEFSYWDLRAFIGEYPEWNSGWPGLCRLQPTTVDVRSVHRCGQWQLNENWFLLDWNEIFATQRAQAKAASLEAELKAVKKLSLERYHQLQKQKKKLGKTAKPKADPPG